MPRLNWVTGEALMSSEAAGDVSVDRRVLVGAASQANWLHDVSGMVIASVQVDAARDRWEVQTFSASGSGLRIVVDGGGASTLVAGGNRWLAWANGRGMFGSLGKRAAAYPLGAGRDGTLAWVREYATRQGLILTAPDGSETEVPDALVRDIQVLGPTAAIWWDLAGGVRTVGRKAIRPALPAQRTRLVTLNGDDWLVYWSEGTGLIAQIDGAADGYILERRPIAFGHDAAGVPVLNGVGELLVVAWSVTAGEGPHDLVWLIVDTDAPRQRLVAAGPGAPPSAPDPDPPHPQPVPRPPDPPHPNHPAPPAPPKTRFTAAAHLEVHMTSTIALRMGKFFARIDPADAGRGPFGWFPVRFDRQDASDPNCRFELTQPDGKLQIKHVASGALLGADATEYGTDICGQFYGKPNDRGGYESWNGWTLGGDGIDIVLIEYDRDGEKYASAGLTVVAL